MKAKIYQFIIIKKANLQIFENQQTHFFDISIHSFRISASFGEQLISLNYPQLTIKPDLI